MKKICVYCGSNPGKSPEYIDYARLLAKELVARNIGLIYGGAKVKVKVLGTPYLIFDSLSK